MESKIENLAMKRGMALFIDHVIMGLTAVIILLPTLMNLSETMKTPEDLMPLLMSSIYTIPAVVLILVFFVFYEPFFTYKYGWTIGKKLYNLKVTDDSGKPLTFGMSLIRFLLKSVCMSLPYVSIVILIFCYVRQVKHKKVFWDEWIQTTVVQSK